MRVRDIIAEVFLKVETDYIHPLEDAGFYYEVHTDILRDTKTWWYISISYKMELNSLTLGCALLESPMKSFDLWLEDEGRHIELDTKILDHIFVTVSNYTEKPENWVVSIQD